MGEAGHLPLYDLDKALASRNLPAAWFAAAEQGAVFLDQFLLITLLLAEDNSARFEPAARKFLLRFIREIKPRVDQIKTVAYALETVGDLDTFAPDRERANAAMIDLARQLRERRGPGNKKAPPGDDPEGASVPSCKWEI